jgi:hypothetical protein
VACSMRRKGHPELSQCDDLLFLLLAEAEGIYKDSHRQCPGFCYGRFWVIPDVYSEHGEQVRYRPTKGVSLTSLNGVTWKCTAISELGWEANSCRRGVGGSR